MCMNNTLSLSPLWLLRLEHLTPQSVFPNSGIIPLLPYCCLPSLPSTDYVQIPDVGWIFTIINFFVAIGILFFQYTIYREFTGSLFDGFWRKLLFGIFIIVGVILFLGIFNYNRYDSITPDSPETPFFNETWHFVLAFVAYMAVLLYLLRDCGIWMSLSFTVFAFGLGISFLGMLSTLILGALLWLGLAAFSGSGGSNGSRGNIIIEDYDGTYEAYEHGFGIYKDVTGSGKTWRKEDSQYIRIN